MNTTRLLLTAAVLALSLVGCKGKKSDAPAPNPFVGKWSIDYDRTMTGIAAAPDQRPEVAEVMGIFIKKIASDTHIQVTPAEIIYSIADDTFPSPYTITAQNASTLTTKSQQDGKDVIVTFTLVDKKYMTFKSSASNEMDRYVWTRSDPQ
jgi:hypothetical protein